MKEVTAYVHSHWDREWYRDFEDFRLRLIEVFDCILNMLQTNKLDCFYFDGQTCALEDYLEIKPYNYNLIKKLTEQKKLRIGPFYCSTDSFLVSGECYCRNMEMGLNKSKELGETEFLGYLCDTFGHSASVIPILKFYNIDKACLWRGIGDLPADLDWDGIKVTNLIQGYFQDFLNLNLPIQKKAELLKKYIDKISVKSGENVLLPIGADHLCPPENVMAQIKDLNNIYTDYNIKIASPFEYFKKIKTRKKVKGEFLDNSLNFILPGVYSSRIYVKQANARSQWLLSRIAEPLNAIGTYFYNSLNKQNEINYAYKKLIQNHAHDSIYGCGTDSMDKQVMLRFSETDDVSLGVIKRVVRDLSSNNGSLSVINLSSFNYSGVIEINTDKQLPKWMNAVKIASSFGFTDEKLYNINEIPVTEDYKKIYKYLIDVKNIAPFSLKNIDKNTLCKTTYLKTAKNSIENKFIKFEIKNNKIILTDKKNNKQYKDFISITDIADIGDSYNFGALKGDKPISAELSKVELKETNKIRCILSLNYLIDIPQNSTKKGRTKKSIKHKLNIDIILYNQSEFIEFFVNWNNKSKNHLLKIGFNLKEKITTTYNEDLFGITKRNFNPDFNIYDNLPKTKGKEVKPNTSPMQRFMKAQDFILITKGNQEYEVEKNKINLTLLRSTGVISNPKNPARTTPAGPPLETPNLQCIGKNTANFAVAFSRDNKSLFRLADEFYIPYVPLFTSHKDKTFFNAENKLIYALTLDEKKLKIKTYDMKENKISNEIF